MLEVDECAEESERLESVNHLQAAPDAQKTKRFFERLQKSETGESFDPFERKLV